MGLHTFLENFTLRKMPSRRFSEYSQGHFCLMLWAAEIEGAFGTQARVGQGVNGKGYSTRWAETSNIIDLGIEAISDFDSLMSWGRGSISQITSQRGTQSSGKNPQKTTPCLEGKQRGTLHKSETMWSNNSFFPSLLFSTIVTWL